MMTPDEILRKHEDANEMHFHEVDRKFIIEAMEEYAKEKSEKPINLEGNKTAVQWLIEQILVKENTSYFNMRTNDIDLSYYVNKALEMDRYQIIDAYYQCGKDNFEHIKVINRSATEYFTDTYQTEP